MYRFHSAIRVPLVVESVDLLRVRERTLVRARTADGLEGLAATTSRIRYLHPILTQRVAPFFVGRDARDLPTLIEDAYRFQSNYKLAGLPFWSCVAWIELSLLDLLGKAAELPVYALLGRAIRTEVPVYLSHLERHSAPAEVLSLLESRLSDTGAGAVKVKIGGRMSGNHDASPRRTEALLHMLRSELTPETALYVDANGSYDAPGAIEVGRMLEELGVRFFEEPCPFEDYEETRAVTAALTIPVAGGEQDSSLYRWRTIVRDRVVAVAQPDVVYCGGLLRAARIAKLAAAQGLAVSLHNPHQGPSAIYPLHLAALLENPWPHHEVNAELEPGGWFEPAIEVRRGSVPVPQGPGLGVSFDPDELRGARLRGGLRDRARKVLGFPPRSG